MVTSRTHTLVDYLAAVAYISRTTGFVTASKAQAGSTPTSDAAYEFCYEGRKTELTAQDMETAECAIQWAKGLYRTEFDCKLSAAAHKYTVSKPHGTAAYIVEAYRRSNELEATRVTENAAAAATSHHVGEVGAKLQTVVTVKAVKPINSSYGTRYLHTFADPTGNVLTWWASVGNLKAGDVVTIKGTVKEHSAYAGVAQTVLTRIKAL